MLIPCIFLLCACGPKEIGYGSADDGPVRRGQNVAEVMRYPVTGADNTQKMLYHSNLPSIMEQTQRWHTIQYRRQLGLDVSPEDPEYREIPKQRSPFRQ